MLGYKFSAREKILLVALVVILVGVGFYQLVYVPLQNRAKEAQEQVVAARDGVLTSEARVQRMKRMQDQITQLKQSGTGATTMPTFDNIKNVMTLLNGSVGGFSDFEIIFNDLEMASDTVVRRGVDITFSCDAYDQARGVMNALQRGPYLCTVDSLSFRDKDATKSGSGFTGSSSSVQSGTYAATAHVTFFERVTPGTVVPVASEGTSGSKSSSK